MLKKIEVFLYKVTRDKEYRFLLMKRPPENGSVWQPITGHVEKDECLTDAVKREVKEEARVSIARIEGPFYTFSYYRDEGEYKEYVFGAQVKNDVEIEISHEHIDFFWATKDEALNMMKWPDNKKGLQELYSNL